LLDAHVLEVAGLIEVLHFWIADYVKPLSSTEYSHTLGFLYQPPTRAMSPNRGFDE
jgi:hypothetical protein